VLLDIEDRGGHEPETLAGGASAYPALRVASQYIFTMHRLSRVHAPAKTVLDDITLAFFPGAKIGVLGYNGAGKSTLLRIMAGVDQDYRGEAALAAGASVGMLEQEPKLDESKDVRANVEQGVAETRALLDRFNDLAANYSDQHADEFARVQAQIEATDAWNLDTQLEYAMDALRLPPAESEVATLSGGERRRVALCRLLLGAPDLLLLDEPTNHLDAESVAWLERHLAEYRGTVVAVTHDRYFLDNVAGWILELDRGKGIPYEGNYSGWLEQKQGRLAQQERAEKSRARTIAAELDWVRTNPKGRRTKSKARLARYEQLVAEERSVRLEEVQIHIPPGPRLGEKVLVASGLRKAFGEKLLIEDLSFDLPRAGIVGVIGANGAGKTTLFRMITGEEAPDAGMLELGDTVQLAYVDQSRDALDPTKTVWEEISGGEDELNLGEHRVSSRQYTAGFNFKGTDQQARTGTLSGGERNRVHLAKLLRTGGNLLLLDEPTNDLDVDTLRALEQALLAFAGCALLISHDRWFLDRVATHVLAFEGDSQVCWFEGNFEAYEEHRRARLGEAADRPHRITYKRLVRG
jgi:ATP-binding cassette ChvD family protein